MSLYCKIFKDFGSFKLDIEFDAGNEVIALMGASGCGKSMTLRCIAGIVKPDYGKIILNDVVLYDSEKRINLSPQKRKIGLLFQDYALFPNMTVRQNILMGMPKIDAADPDEIIETFHLKGLENHYPSQLSGGQKQRCALARMLASKPEIIMLDEPFSALDSFLRWQLEMEVASVIQKYDKTVLLVSHNRDEVFRLCDKVSVISGGKNQPVKDKHTLYSNPRTYDEALLTGCKNMLSAKASGNTVTVPDIGIAFEHSDIPENLEYIGIRAKKIIPSFMMDAEKTDGYIVFKYTVESVTEGVFSYILMITPEDFKQPLRWEVLKNVYAQLDEHPHEIAIAKKDIMLLSDA